MVSPFFTKSPSLIHHFTILPGIGELISCGRCSWYKEVMVPFDLIFCVQGRNNPIIIRRINPKNQYLILLSLSIRYIFSNAFNFILVC